MTDSRPQGAPKEDWALARDGDPEAFERLYRSHVDRIYALARRMAGAQAAEDLTQEIFIRAWERLHTFRGDAKFGTWLHRLAVNFVLTRRERMKRRESRTVRGDETLLSGFRSRSQRPGLVVDMEEAVGRLPDGARQIFVLYDVEGYSHKEIAGMMEISVGTSKSQLHRARMLLREHLA